MRAGSFTFVFGMAIGLSLLAPRAIAQQGPPLSPSAASLTLDTEAVSAPRFIAVHGRRALIDGYASQGLEAWAYPFQVLSGYRVAFRPQGVTTAIDGSEILRRVVYQPDSVTRIYLGPDFIVRENLFVPLDRAGAILTYAIQSKKPVAIEVHATPVLNLMWPAALGGQSAEWNPSLSAFVLSEPADGFTALVGSPQIVEHDDTANRTARGVAEAGIGFTLQPEPSGRARVFLTLNPPHAADPGKLLHELFRDSDMLRAESTAHFRQVQDHLLAVETPDDRVNRAFAWAEIALDQAWVCNPDLGCGYVAGYGPSRAARRPQYAWFFAGDGMVAAEAAMAAGDRDHARQELEFVLRYQDSKTGMIWHELSQSASFLDWAGKFPYMFVHVDVTFQFLNAVAGYVAASGDVGFANQHWPAIEAAYRYCLSAIDSASSLPRIPADKEGGNEQDRMSDDLGLSTSWVAAAAGFSQLALLTGHTGLAAEALRASQRARDSVPGRYWDAAQSFWISGHNPAGEPMRERRSGPTEAITLHVFSPEQNSLLLNQLASSSFQTDWGTRSIGAGSPGFDPESYGKGSVWPVATAATAEAFWSEHRPVTALALWQTLLPLSRLDSLGHIPEVLAGNFYRPQIESVPEQTWSSASFLEATIHGLLGLDIDAIANRLVFAPRLPAEWNDISVGHIQVAAASVSLALHRDAAGLTLKIDNPGPPFEFEFAPDLPLGATIRKAVFNQRPIAVSLESLPQQTSARVVLDAPHGSSELRLDLEGGISVIPDQPAPMLGDASVGIHIIDVHIEGNTLIVAADVPADRASHLRLKTGWQVANAEGATVEPVTPGMVQLTFAAAQDASSPYRRVQARIALLR